MDNLINVQERRGLRVFVAALILLIAGVLLSMKLGAVPLTWSDLYQIITGGDTSKIGQIIMTIRLPRVVVGFLAGMNLALAGVILQGILRNFGGSRHYRYYLWRCFGGYDHHDSHAYLRYACSYWCFCWCISGIVFGLRYFLARWT